MRMQQKLISAALLGVGILAAGATASAQTTAPVACSTVSTVRAWDALTGGCQDQDKLFTYIGGSDAGYTDMPATAGVEISSPFPDLHQVLFTGGTAQSIIPGQGPGPFYTSYSIQVTDPLRYITAVNHDVTGSNLAGGNYEVLKHVIDINGNLLYALDSVNGAAVGPVPLNHQYILIREWFMTTGNAILNTSQNTFSQIPEPATLALLGLGLIGLAAVRRRA